MHSCYVAPSKCVRVLKLEIPSGHTGTIQHWETGWLCDAFLSSELRLRPMSVFAGMPTSSQLLTLTQILEMETLLRSCVIN